MCVYESKVVCINKYRVDILNWVAGWRQKKLTSVWVEQCAFIRPGLMTKILNLAVRSSALRADTKNYKTLVKATLIPIVYIPLPTNKRLKLSKRVGGMDGWIPGVFGLSPSLFICLFPPPLSLNESSRPTLTLEINPS